MLSTAQLHPHTRILQKKKTTSHTTKYLLSPAWDGREVEEHKTEEERLIWMALRYVEAANVFGRKIYNTYDDEDDSTAF